MKRGKKMALQKYNKENPEQPDSFTGGLVVTEDTHQMIHKGGMYSTTIIDDAVVDTGTLSIGMNIPTGIQVSLKSIIALGFGWYFKLTAMPYTSFTPSATYKTPNNHCLLSCAPASLCTINVNPTGLVSSDQFGFVFGGGTSVAGQGSSGTGSFTSEFIIGAGNHGIIVENLSGATSLIQVRLVWLEMEA